VRIPFLELTSRLTGFSTPIFGVSWDPPKLDVDVARRLLTILEDRRVLFAPHELEVPRHAVESVLQIREHLTAALTEVDHSSQLGQSLAAMRGACRQFLDQVRSMRADGSSFMSLPLFDQWLLGSALGELRAVFGIHIGQIAMSYGIDVEPQLAELLPPPPDPGS